MSEKQEGANLILRLYEIRREETMRRARVWFTTEFNPQSAQDIFSVLVGEHSADFRMVASYWDMAAAFVNHGAIDEAMFNDINRLCLQKQKIAGISRQFVRLPINSG